MADSDKIRNAVLNGTRNVLIIGPGGTGKSYLIKQIVREARVKGLTCEATAATGVAAVNVDGSTLHSFFGVGLCQGSIDAIIGRVRRNPEVVKRIRETDILIVDEISMIGDKFFGKLDLVAKYYRKSEAPFGGMRVVVSGDFLQLPPIGEEWVFDSETWSQMAFAVFFMTEPRRFTDKSFYLTLMRAREGKLTQRDMTKINVRVKEYNKYMLTEDQHAVKPTKMYSLRANVEAINTEEMHKLPGTARIFQAADIFTPRHSSAKKAQYDVKLDYIAAKVLTFKIGAQVMLTWNINVEAGLCNGTRGVIVDMSTEVITIETRNGKEVSIPRKIFEIVDKKAKVVRKQFPLILAFALTIHKCQGSTLDFCVVDLGPEVFAPGQGYVALSRARSWDSLLVSSFTRSAIKADPRALEFVTHLEESVAGGDEGEGDDDCALAQGGADHL